MAPLSELRQRLLLPYYLINFCFCLIFFVIRYIPALCESNFDLSLSPPEGRLYGTLLFLLVIKYRSAASAEEFLSILFLYGKLYNIAMFYWYGKTLVAIAYAVVWGGLFTFFPQPTYQGPTKIVSLSAEDLSEIERNRFEIEDGPIGTRTRLGRGKAKQEDLYWVVFFYTTWNPASLNFEYVVARASMIYTSPSLRFGKIDLDKYPALSTDYSVSLSPTSLDLPTLVLLKNGREIKRLPVKSEEYQTGEGSEDKTGKGAGEVSKNKTLRNVRETWDRLGWDRSLQSVISAFNLESISKSNKSQ